MKSTDWVSSSARLETLPVNFAIPAPVVVSFAVPVVVALKLIYFEAGTESVAAAFTDNDLPAANVMSSPGASVLISAAEEIVVSPL